MRTSVALRKESVDRNLGKVLKKETGPIVALRKESVDRNYNRNGRARKARPKSLSARRAWIEIGIQHRVGEYQGSLSARRAWIEINALVCLVGSAWSLSARRAWIEMCYVRGCFFCVKCRSPQGERG